MARTATNPLFVPAAGTFLLVVQAELNRLIRLLLFARFVQVQRHLGLAAAQSC